MPEKLRWIFEPITAPITMDLKGLLTGKQIEYLIDDKTWEEVVLVGFNTHTLSSTGFSIKGVYIEVLPLMGTDFGKQWYAGNQPPLPIKVFHANRLRAKVVDAVQGIEEA